MIYSTPGRAVGPSPPALVKELQCLAETYDIRRARARARVLAETLLQKRFLHAVSLRVSSSFPLNSIFSLPFPLPRFSLHARETAQCHCARARAKTRALGARILDSGKQVAADPTNAICTRYKIRYKTIYI